MNSDELKRKLGVDDDGTYRIDPETGRVQKEGFFGWKDTDTRVDPESGTIQEEGFLGWRNTETRIDPDSGVVQKEGFFGHSDTDTRMTRRQASSKSAVGSAGRIRTSASIPRQGNIKCKDGLAGRINANLSCRYSTGRCHKYDNAVIRHRSSHTGNSLAITLYQRFGGRFWV